MWPPCIRLPVSDCSVRNSLHCNWLTINGTVSWRIPNFLPAPFHDFIYLMNLQTVDLWPIWDWILSNEYWIFKVRLRRINLLKTHQKNDRAKRLPQIFNIQYSIVNSGLSGLGTVHATLLDRNIHLHIRIVHRKFLERLYLPAAGSTINRSSPVHVLELRYADRLLRQHPDCKLSVA